jgi:hypothetical protein
MAKVDKKHFENDKAYCQGMEDMYDMIKAIFEMSVDDRVEKVGKANISMILDEYDFQQIKEHLETLNKYYIIRGIKVDDNGYKHVVVESDRLSCRPDEILINAFLNCHKNKHLTFATTETIYVRE